MKIWVDVLTPKQANMYAALQRHLQRRGCEVFATCREYREVVGMMRLRNLECRIVGRHGGGDIKRKLLESARRTTELTELIADEKPDRAVSFCSPEAARVAFGLRVPHYCVGDSPHAEAVCRLTVPLSRKLFTPWIIPKEAWRQYGAVDRNIVRYKALDPISWIRDDVGGLDGLSLPISSDAEILVVRLHEEQASYSLAAEVRDETPLRAVELIRQENPNVYVVVLARYWEQIQRTKKRLGDGVLVPEGVVNGIALLRRAAAFIGSGGTMTAEAALLGIPTISCYPNPPTLVDRYLFRVGLARRATQAREVADLALRAIEDPGVSRRTKLRARRVVSMMQDPTKLIAARVASVS